MTFSGAWELRPLVGAGAVRFGMTCAEVVRLLGDPGVAPAGRSEARRVGWRDGGLVLHFDPGVVFIEFSRGAGLLPVLCGVDVFRTPASEVVEALLNQGHTFDASDPEVGHTYVFEDLQVALWRQVVPEDDEGELGRWFDTVALGEAGYYR